MLSSLHARMMRTAISPRLATRIFSNIQSRKREVRAVEPRDPSTGPKFEQRLAKLHWFGIFDHDLGDYSLGLGLYLIHHLHRLDDANHRLRTHFGPHLNIRGRFG